MNANTVRRLAKRRYTIDAQARVVTIKAATQWELVRLERALRQLGFKREDVPDGDKPKSPARDDA